MLERLLDYKMNKKEDFEKSKHFLRNLKNKEELNEFKKSLEFLFNRNQGRSDFNLSLFYGLVFGILGSAFFTMIYELLIKNYSEWIQSMVTILIFAVLLFFLGVFRKELKEVDKDKKELKELLEAINQRKEELRRVKV